MGQYEEIARSYSDRVNVDKDPVMERVYQFWLEICSQNIDGNFKNKNVLDLACGSGRSSRLLAEKGVCVVGIEPEHEMLKIARKKENLDSLGIFYVIGKLPYELPAVCDNDSSFDLITGAHLLHYANSRKQLFDMTKEIFRLLKPGKWFVGINNDPEHPVSRNGFNLFKNENRWIGKAWSEGSKLELNLTNVDQPIDFYWWSRKTYEEAFLEAGFSCPIFHRVDGFSGEKRKIIEEDISLNIISACKPK